MKAWWESSGSTQSFSQLSEGRTSGGVDRSGIEWLKTVSSIKEENMGSVDDGKGDETVLHQYQGVHYFLEKKNDGAIQVTLSP